jgi:hypothetical protein
MDTQCLGLAKTDPGMVAKVFSPNGVDIGRRLVSAGWALAYRRYSKDYVDAEAEARKAKRGMWRGTFVKPWEWRASSPPRRTQAPVWLRAAAGVGIFGAPKVGPWRSRSTAVRRAVAE